MPIEIPDRPLNARVFFRLFKRLKTRWLLKPWIPAGSLTILVGLAKVGKTTFLIDMLTAMHRRVPFLGVLVPRQKAIYCTEQSPHTLREQASTLSRRGKDTRFYAKIQMREGWAGMCSALERQCREEGYRLVLIDTWAGLAGFLGEGENHTGEAMSRLDGLLPLIAMGCTVVISVHEGKPIKGGRATVNAGRGASALAGGVDQIVQITNPSQIANTAIRVLKAEGRYPETPTKPVSIERYENTISQKATSLIGTPNDGYRKPLYSWRYLSDNSQVTSHNDDGYYTVQELMGRWSKSRTAVRHWIETTQPKRKGDGTKNRPYRYAVDD